MHATSVLLQNTALHMFYRCSIKIHCIILMQFMNITRTNSPGYITLGCLLVRRRLICPMNHLLIRQYALTQMCHTVLQRSRLDINNLLMRYQHKIAPMCLTKMCLLTIYSSQMCYTVLQRRRFMYQQKIAPMC